MQGGIGVFNATHRLVVGSRNCLGIKARGVKSTGCTLGALILALVASRVAKDCSLVSWWVLRGIHVNRATVCNSNSSLKSEINLV